MLRLGEVAFLLCTLFDNIVVKQDGVVYCSPCHYPQQSSWVSGLIWNTGFQQNSVTDSKVSNRYLLNRHNTNIFMRDTMLMKPTEKEEINIQVHD